MYGQTAFTFILIGCILFRRQTLNALSPTTAIMSDFPQLLVLATSCIIIIGENIADHLPIRIGFLVMVVMLLLLVGIYLRLRGVCLPRWIFTNGIAAGTPAPG